MHKNDDSSATIVALATAPSSSALAIIRISGSNALKAANTLFYPINNHILKPRLLTLGWIMIDGKKMIKRWQYLCQTQIVIQEMIL